MPRNSQQKPETITDSPRRRIKILHSVVLVALGIILVRLFIIQIFEHNDWVAKANEQHTLLETITAKRGEIYMIDHGEPVAVVLNQTTYQLVIDPAVTKKEDVEKVINDYAKDYVAADLNEVYNTENLRYSIVAKNIPRDVAQKIADSETPAIWLKKTNQRVYPEGQLASGLLGFVNNDGVGQYGAEGSFNKQLAGEDGLVKATADVNKVALSIGNDNVKIPAKDGENIVLSVDRSLEQGVEELAMNAINSTAATNASVLVMDPNTGEVITMANLPNYDPANYDKVTDAAAFVNYTTEVPYEPASICKSFTFSAAINEGKMTADTTYFNEHYTTVDGWKIENAEQRGILYGTINMKTALYWSLNTGSIQALRLLGDNPNQITQQGRERLYDYYYNKFRLGQATGIELIEAEGFIPDPNEGWGRDSTYANMTFGQNLGITMIQTASAFSAVVNGGTWHTPTIVKGVLKNGEIVKDSASENSAISDQILSEETSAAMRDMLIYNRGYKVTGGIDRPGYDIGGKSGTAQVVVNGAYDDTFAQLVGSYIGFVGPSGELPKYVIMVKMWGEGASIGSGDAMDLFDKLSNYLIDYQKIKPRI
ncbi:penicillin-binding protein 2 [Candidatus Saccharibacteria bacterium]|nr:penicillin-binding protein 2 [Candidatus Saccharibacteria bacterium]